MEHRLNLGMFSFILPCQKKMVDWWNFLTRNLLYEKRLWEIKSHADPLQTSHIFIIFVLHEKSTYSISPDYIYKSKYLMLWRY